MYFSLTALRNGALALSLAPALAACGDKVPEATDDQLLQILASDSVFSSSDRPLSIPKSAVECVRVLSGLDEEIFKDMPAEMLETMKTGCRQELDKHLKDEAKNPMGFQLAHFENKELAERITKLKETSDEANRKAAQERRQHEEREARAKAERELEELKSQYAGFVQSIDQRIQSARPICDEWIAAQTALKKKKNKWNNWSYRQPSPICTDGIAQIRTTAATHLDTLSATEVSGRGTFFNFNKPYFGNASPEWLDEQVKKLNEDVERMKVDLAR